MKRIIGEFVKQVWAGRSEDEAMTVGRVKFDATRAVLAGDLEFIHNLADCDYGSDEIGRACVTWDGPCSVYVAQSVAAFFGVQDASRLRDITQEMLDSARTAFGGLDGDEATLELRLKVKYALNGVPLEAMQLNLELMVSHAIGEGMLTGSSSAEVEEHSMTVRHVPTETVIEEA